jgi:hypothetical protein
LDLDVLMAMGKAIIAATRAQTITASEAKNSLKGI